VACLDVTVFFTSSHLETTLFERIADSDI
jgi:hypothetical protein